MIEQKKCDNGKLKHMLIVNKRAMRGFIKAVKEGENIMIERIIITSLIVFAIWYTMQEGEIFGFVRKLFYNIPEKLKQPLFECPVCMAPWYGSLIYWLLWRNTLVDWLVTVIAAMGLNAIISKMFPDE